MISRLAIVLGLGLTAGAATADELTPVRVNTFPNAKALPFHVGIANGIFAKHGIKLERYLAAYVESLRRVRDPAHRVEAVGLLIDTLKLPQGGGGAHL